MKNAPEFIFFNNLAKGHVHLNIFYKNTGCSPVIHSHLWPPEMENTQTRHEKDYNRYHRKWAVESDEGSKIKVQLSCNSQPVCVRSKRKTATKKSLELVAHGVILFISAIKYHTKFLLTEGKLTSS